jgi:hypothetical protein
MFVTSNGSYSKHLRVPTCLILRSAIKQLPVIAARTFDPESLPIPLTSRKRITDHPMQSSAVWRHVQPISFISGYILSSSSAHLEFCPESCALGARSEFPGSAIELWE